MITEEEIKYPLIDLNTNDPTLIYFFDVLISYKMDPDPMQISIFLDIYREKDNFQCDLVDKFFEINLSTLKIILKKYIFHDYNMKKGYTKDQLLVRYAKFLKFNNDLVSQELKIKISSAYYEDYAGKYIINKELKLVKEYYQKFLIEKEQKLLEQVIDKTILTKKVVKL